MDREYMLSVIQDRIKELEAKYRAYFDTEAGPSKSSSGAACMRSRIKKDLDSLRLIEQLLLFCPKNIQLIEDDLVNVFDRLVEPRRLR